MSSPSTRAPFLSKGALHRLASGLEAGVIGGIAMLVLLVAGSMWRGDVWWAPANLLGSTFYGRRAFRAGLGMATLSGAAFHIVITGTVGALFGLACGGVRERRRLVVLGSLAGVFWYYLADAIFWNHVNPLVPAYAPQPMTLVAHALFGACLGYMGQNLSRENLGSRDLEGLGARESFGAREDFSSLERPAQAENLANWSGGNLENPTSANPDHANPDRANVKHQNSIPEDRDLEAIDAPSANEIPSEDTAQGSDSTLQPPPLPRVEPVGHEQGRMEIG